MAFQGIFRRINKFVVVRTIHLTSKKVLEAGTVIDMEKHNVRLFQLRLWFKRRRIGTLDTPWANAMLKGITRPENAAIGGPKTPTEDNPPLVGLETKEGAQELADALTAVKDKKVADDKAEQDRLYAEAKAEQDAIDAAKAKVDEPADKPAEPTAAEKAAIKKEKRNARERAKRAAKKANK